MGMDAHTSTRTPTGLRRQMKEWRARHLVGLDPMGGGNGVAAGVQQGHQLQEGFNGHLLAKAGECIEDVQPPAKTSRHASAAETRCRLKPPGCCNAQRFPHHMAL